jgi:mannose-6-phosphate isomerase-like protein (cupin superfamily)
MILDWGPDHSWPTVHHTDTLDFHLVLSGSIDLILDTGIAELKPGDCAVITGIDHAWRAGPNGCRLSSLMLGTPPPA